MRSVLRLFFVALLAASALGKLLDMPGFYAIVGSYQALPEEWTPFAAWALTLVELALALWLLSEKSLRRAALATCAIHAFYFVWLSVTLLRGLDLPNCGCFGVYWARPLRWHTPLEDLVLFVLAFLLLRRTADRENS
ncbi:MAG: DoxX family membrane protein [Deltaproteobacteria bacterium]|nr:DoxX family membrane protein [Deltaproteobacteria bacterium]MBM4299371.1 DoxX family membrane protein [Deltaproteobacteria bacterium]